MSLPNAAAASVFAAANVRGELLGVVRDAHAPAAAARRGLDEHRVADRSANASASASVSTGPSLPGTTGTPGLRHRLARDGLVAHALDRLGRRADEGRGRESAHARANCAFSARNP